MSQLNYLNKDFFEIDWHEIEVFENPHKTYKLSCINFLPYMIVSFRRETFG